MKSEHERAPKEQTKDKFRDLLQFIKHFTIIRRANSMATDFDRLIDLYSTLNSSVSAPSDNQLGSRIHCKKWNACSCTDSSEDSLRSDIWILPYNCTVVVWLDMYLCWYQPLGPACWTVVHHCLPKKKKN